MALTSPPELQNFIAAAKQKGASDEAIVGMLEGAGWSRSEVWRILGQHYESLTQVQIPPGKKIATEAKDAFLYLFSFAALATWTFALGAICFILIEEWIKDPLAAPSYGSYAAESYEISIGLACLIITFPLYLFVMKVIVSDTRRSPEKLDSPVRKWLTYIMLFIAAACIIGDLITVLTYYLRGEVTGRFLAEATVILVISGGVFWYYLGFLREARKGTATGGSRDFPAALLASVAFLAIVVVGFYKTRGPMTQRLLHADRKRVSMINQLANEIRVQFTDEKLPLPPSLTEVQKAKYKDPETGQPPEYSVTSPTRYSICTTFVLPTPGDEQQKLEYAFWTHPDGHKCFDFDTHAPIAPFPYTYNGDF
jgi:Domain of unknown function (DUF5671)